MALTTTCDTTTNQATGHLEWKINGWTGLADEVGESTKSDAMQCVGHSWKLAVYPGGVNDETKEHVGICLYYRGSLEALRTEFSITLVNQLHGDPGSLVCSGARTFRKHVGSPIIIKRARLLDESNGFKLNNRVIIRVDITTYGDVEHKVNTGSDPWTPPDTLRQDMASLLASGDDTDVEIYVAHRTFHAHSPILSARSPYLKGMLASSMREAETKEIKETEMDPDTFEVLLRFMYTDLVDDDAVQANGEDLLRGANFYVLHGLKMRCEVALCKELTVENVASRPFPPKKTHTWCVIKTHACFMF